MNILHGVFGDQTSQNFSKKGYKLGRVIGEGSYSKVRLAGKLLDTGKHIKIACKIVNRQKASHDFVTKFLPREIDIIQRVSHPNIVRVFDIFDSPNHVFIFMEFCNKGDLLDFIRNGGALTETHSRTLFRQLVSAVQYLHNHEISHRDLKCENVLLASEHVIKLTDFGFCRYCRDDMGKRILSSTFCGSAAYAAPEILQGLPYNPKMYDVWSLGCILYIMATATMPFDDSNIKKMLRRQNERKYSFHGKNPAPLTPNLRYLIRRILEPDITRRSTLDHIARDVWMLQKVLDGGGSSTRSTPASTGSSASAALYSME